MRVVVRFVRGFSGRGGFPSGPYYGAEIISCESGDVVSSTRVIHMTAEDAFNAAKRIMRRKKWTFGRIASALCLAIRSDQ